MVNFNFGLGTSNPTQDGATQTTDPVAVQAPVTQDDTAAAITSEPIIQKPVEVAPAPVTSDSDIQFDVIPADTDELIKPVVDMPITAPVNPFATQENTTEKENTEVSIDTPIIETTNPFAAPATEESKSETPVEAPVNPFAVQTNPFAAPEDKSEEVAKEETPTTTMSFNPFATPVAEEVIAEEVKEDTPAPAIVNPFATQTVNEEKVEERKEDKPAPTAIINPFAATPEKEEKKVEEVKEKKVEVEKKPNDSAEKNYDPMATMSLVKKDIVEFVDYHKKNIKQHEDEIKKLEIKITEEKKLLREKGDAYAKMLKELHGLTQNFGGENNAPRPNVPRPQNQPPRPQQNHPMPKPQNQPPRQVANE